MMIRNLLLGLGSAVLFAAPAPAASAELQVAFVISEGFNMIDFAGPWEVFQDTHTPSKDGGMHMPDLYTVSTSGKPVRSTGGMLVTPGHTLESAPPPDIVVIGAQSDNSPELLAWLKAQRARGATVMSVCTGARKLALSGLLDGKRATTHHEFLAPFKKQFQDVDWIEGQRFVRADEGLYTAGGLTSGIDLALHVVAQRFGTEVAQATADYMEYRSDGWKREPG
jgi:transcriptional regulator GlxA family with amidase domain